MVRRLGWEGINHPGGQPRGEEGRCAVPRAGRVWELPQGRGQLLTVLWEVNEGSGLRFTLSPQDRVQSGAGREARDLAKTAAREGPGRSRSNVVNHPTAFNQAWGPSAGRLAIRKGQDLAQVLSSLCVAPSSVNRTLWGHTYAGKPSCLCWSFSQTSALNWLGLQTPRTHTMRDLRRGDNLPAHSPGVYAAMGTPGALGLLSMVGGGTGREGDSYLKTHTVTVVTLGAPAWAE